MNYERFHAALARAMPACAAAYRGECAALGEGVAEVGGVAWSEAACLLLGVLLEDWPIEARYPLPGERRLALGGGQNGPAGGATLDALLARDGGALDGTARMLLAATLAGCWMARDGTGRDDVHAARQAVARGLHARLPEPGGYNGMMDAACQAIPLVMRAVDVDLEAIQGLRERTWLDCDMQWLSRLTRSACGGYGRRVLGACLEAGIGQPRERGHALRDVWAARAVLGGFWDGTRAMVRAGGVPDWGADIAFITGGLAQAVAGLLRLWACGGPRVDERLSEQWIGRATEAMRLSRRWSGTDWSDAAGVLCGSAWDAFTEQAREAARTDSVNNLGRLALAWEAPLAAGRARTALAMGGWQDAPPRVRRRG